MIGVTMTATVIFSIHTWEQNQKQAENMTSDAVQSTSRMLNDKTTLSRIIKNQLVGNSEKIENVTTYLTKPIDQYLMYVYEQQNSTDELVSFPNQIKDLYANYEELSAIYIVLNQLPEYYESSRENKGGEIKKGTPKLLDAFYIKLPITQGGAESGSIFIGFQKKELDMILENLTSFNGLSLYMISGTTNRLYTFHDNKIAKETFERQEMIITESLKKNSQLPIDDLEKNNFVQHQELSDDYRILAVLDKKSVKIETGKNLAPLIIGIIILDNILLIFLYKTFKRYSQQVSIVMQAMDQTAAGNLETRIDITNTEYELKELSIGINEMLDSINQFVEDIYKLEIKQQDAHMRALQAQINPHFLYNTLEYIRMYAISEGSEELADVVYAFSALLRNNTNQEKTITLKEELDFCEKYVYLYQMRYPNRVAYHFMIDPDLEKIEVPKFVIQPLVENYFKHGIDFTRFDNALSVKVLQEGKRVRIIIKDNGKGMTEKRLKQIEEKLSHPKVELHGSIGLQNVNERLRASFGSSYYMSLENNETGGLTVSITFKEG
ncbi:ATP-binding protein [Enterococcus faecium]|jgi:two-component system sensor histidine kinase YesM|nr:Two-component sensor kinase yesM, associated with MetSO reductase [Enterococcus faecium ATCC 8459 = NRRL B-2354]EFF20903.1 sensor histidine kinase [Enterococcus faecium E1071]EFF30826.1 sensor histidine kinase [Enterococcus faecium U0317]EFF35565.1 sensor histidine kinase [Enterococcus faecium E1162]EHM33303.1 sensor histidine kinase [Enterococcus faecium E4453]EHM33396.1 sensor histidine kinase [Enterococcus faecium E4452]MBK4750989.1 ATP-binding protein [Enterococcus faecium]